jgi:16S rRNA (cytosine967-C5)-methyltransferase
MPFEDKLQICLLLCHNGNKHVASFLPADQVALLDAYQSSKLEWLMANNVPFDVNRLFVFDAGFSEGITKPEWLLSIMQQPALFIRVRKQNAAIVQKLEENNIPYQWYTATCLKLPNGAAIDKLLPPDAYVVQDASSQATGGYFDAHAGQLWWDCCSGAGGKSLLLKDKQPAVKLTVTDRRESILHNLQKRFQQYGHTPAQRIVLDVSDAHAMRHTMAGKLFDNIICDVPCTGSGTWARTPEQLYFFKQELLQDLPALQRNIAINAAQQLKAGGTLYYITCSVFSQENEHVVNDIIEATGLQLKQMQLLNGIAGNADCLFIALLQKV